MHRPPEMLCPGFGAHPCGSCARNAERHPEVERAPGVRWVPVLEGLPRCAYYLPAPLERDQC